MVKSAELSKVLSHALRHEPWLYELELDEEGWASIDAVLGALKEERPEWQDLARTDVERMIESASKRRHEVAGDRIRALYGHSVPGRLRLKLASPPTTLFHATSPEAARIILNDGLKPMSRQYVHLSVDQATAREVGRRKSRTPALFDIEAGAAHRAGIAFYEGNDKVWLADLVPSRFVSVSTAPVGGGAI